MCNMDNKNLILTLWPLSLEAWFIKAGKHAKLCIAAIYCFGFILNPEEEIQFYSNIQVF
jgi:hypothetical protein